MSAESKSVVRTGTAPLSSDEANRVFGLRNIILDAAERGSHPVSTALNACLGIAIDIAADPKQMTDEDDFLQHVRMLFRNRRAGNLASCMPAPPGGSS